MLKSAVKRCLRRLHDYTKAKRKSQAVFQDRAAFEALAITYPSVNTTLPKKPLQTITSQLPT